MSSPRAITSIGFLALLAIVLPMTLPSCQGKRGSPGKTVINERPPEETPGQTLPGVVVDITSVSGGSGAGGAFRVGDRISIAFTVKTTAGNDLALDSLSLLAAMVSGPTFNYQRIIGRQTNLATLSSANADGSHTYTFDDPIPAAYLAPLNDTASLGSGDGEAGQALVSGTYTVGLEAYKSYLVGEVTYRDAGNTTEDLLFGSASSLDPREVVTVNHCNQCHRQIRAHGGIRVNNVKHCLLCHTSGAEDRNVDSVESGTPGRAIDFRVMIHKIHNGEHLPSVLGVNTAADGSRNYTTTPQPYRLVGFRDEVVDYSAIAFPVWPNLNQPMPRDAGYTALSTTEKGLEDIIREGVTACEKCHGDPDGDGPVTAPAQGDVAYSQPSRRACGSCHDDINWDYPYVANTQTMPAQPNDSGCATSDCHNTAGTSLSVEDAHVHPVKNLSVNPGINVSLGSLVEAGTADDDGTIDPGEKIQVSLSFTNDAGEAVAPSALSALSLAISGPINNQNILLSTSIPTAALTGSQPFTTKVPQPIALEFVGDGTGAGGEVFTTSRTPHWNVTGGATTVRVRTATSGGATTASGSATALNNYIDVASSTDFARNDFVVVEDGVGGKEEYAQVIYVDGTRLWLGSPLRFTHANGSTVSEVTLNSKTVTTDYTLDAATGSITEVTEFGAGNAVVVSYTTDYVLPTVFPPAINDSPDLGEAWGKWKGLSILDGTYTLGVWASRAITVTAHGESTGYRGTSLTATEDFLVGSATELTTYSTISSADNCNACHIEVLFHGGGRRGFNNCILCHGTAGSEDRPRYTAANAPDTSGITIDFRSMLHKIHMGEELANAETYTLVGFGASAYPNNYTSHTYSEVGFPAMPGGTKQCTSCHGDSNSWKAPIEREHPGQTAAPRVWYSACTSCHDSDAAAAHADVNTSGGTESCAVCHGEDREFSVEVSHREF